MGLFDSSCALTGLSLSSLQIAAIPLQAVPGGFVVSGPPEFGVSDRGGGLNSSPRDASAARMLVAAAVYRALMAQGLDVAAAAALLGRPVAPTIETGEVHWEGEIFRRQSAAVRAAQGIPWLLAALAACAAEAEAEVSVRLAADAPAAGWLAHAAASAYGIVVAGERRAMTSLDDVVCELEDMGVFAFDPDTLTAYEDPIGVWVVAAGVWTFVDARPFLWIVDGARRAPLSDLAAASDLYANCDLDTEPTYAVDDEALRAALPTLPAPLLPHDARLHFGVIDMDPPPWVTAQERQLRVPVFARVSIWFRPKPPDAPVLPLDDTTREAIERALDNGENVKAVLLHMRATNAGKAAAAAYLSARLESRRK